MIFPFRQAMISVVFLHGEEVLHLVLMYAILLTVWSSLGSTSGRSPGGRESVPVWSDELIDDITQRPEVVWYWW